MHSRPITLPFCIVAAGLLVACGDDAPGSDAGSSLDASNLDAAVSDLGLAMDAGAEPDSGAPDTGPRPDSGTPDIGPRPDSGVHGEGPCEGRACLTRIEDLAAWDTVAAPSTQNTRCDITEELWFLIPKDETAPLDVPIYASVSAWPEPLDLVRDLLAPTTVTVDDFFRLAQREDQRSFYLGKIYRLSSDPERFGFHVLGSDYWGFPEQSAITPVYQVLVESFSLPLVYAPQTVVAAQQAEQFVDPEFEIARPGCPAQDGCPNLNGSCIVVPSNTMGCGSFAEGRSIQAEHDQKIQVVLAEGAHVLPIAPSSLELNLISGGSFGRDRTPLVPDGPGALTVTDQSGGLYYQLEQRFTAGADRITLRWEHWTNGPSAPPVVLREPWATEYLRMYGTVNDSEEWDDVLVISSCGHESLPLYYAEAELEGGGRFRLGYRHAMPFAGSGPLELVSADVELDAQLRRITDYWGLTYAGEHHNWNNQFWVIFDVPISYQNQGVFGLWIDEAGFACCPLDAVHLLGPNLESLGTVPVVEYRRAPSFL